MPVSLPDILQALTVERLRSLVGRLGIDLNGNAAKQNIIRSLSARRLALMDLLGAMTLPDLRVLSHRRGLVVRSRVKADFTKQLALRISEQARGKLLYRTRLGRFYWGDSQRLLGGPLGRSLRGRVNLILTSPPFPLNKKKRYGNLQGQHYRDWFTALAEGYADLLAKDGSIVIEMGNAWEPGRPVQSLLPLESLTGFVRNPRAGLRLCQQFVCYNPARLPSPAQWVTVERTRVTDSFTHVWWMAKSDKPKADNRRVLRPYSDSMKLLLERGCYNAGKRPSEHSISDEGFLSDHGGSIMPNVLEIGARDGRAAPRLPEAMLRFANTHSNDEYHRRCQRMGITPHPARMPLELAAFFIELLTKPGDLVLDPFGGSNVTGYVADRLKRRWLVVEVDREYGEHSRIRFASDD